MSVQELIIDLITQINEERISIKEKTDTILYKCLCKSDKPFLSISILYKLIFHCYKQAPDVAYRILSGFIQFGQSSHGRPYKPMMDYFVIEAINGLLELGGWSILKPCLITLHQTIDSLKQEPIFKHILERVCKQLKADVEDVYCSDLCYNLPREKSFTWGWFSYDLAQAYYGESNKIVSAKNTRQYMMYYRKLLTNLRKNTVEIIPVDDEISLVPLQLEETWSEILSTFETEEYQWIDAIIAMCIPNETAEACETAEAAEAYETASAAEACQASCQAAACETASEAEAEASEAEASEIEAFETEEFEIAPATSACETASEAVEASACETAVGAATIACETEAACETAAVEESKAPIKNKGWLHSLFGWS